MKAVHWNNQSIVKERRDSFSADNVCVGGWGKTREKNAGTVASKKKSKVEKKGERGQTRKSNEKQVPNNYSGVPRER